FKNIHLCEDENDCKKDNDISVTDVNTEILYIGENSNIRITNTTFDNIHGNRGIIAKNGVNLKMINNTFRNGIFENGLIEVNTEQDVYGNIDIENSVFENLFSNNGPVLNIKNIEDNQYNQKIIFTNSTFINNSALYFGGVVYSVCQNTNKSVFFNGCNFINNTAHFGNVAYSINKKNEPNFSNIEDLRNSEGDIVTNPSHLKFIDNPILNNISFVSGEILPKGISCKDINV
ncbi:hypothetical protein PIROE2DRAFT_65601, partial [Piromyces sp. E2]